MFSAQDKFSENLGFFWPSGRFPIQLIDLYENKDSGIEGFYG
jgi:hypothetical protein